MLTAAKYRLYPTKPQEKLLAKHFGCVRLVYNLALEAKTQALSIQDAGWGKFNEYLRYKSAWRGKQLLRARRFDPSSKRHNGCGYINKELSLKERRWRCPRCGELVDRDHNAAKNILEYALSRHSGMGRPAGPVEPPAMAGAMKQEKFRRAKPVS